MPRVANNIKIRTESSMQGQNWKQSCISKHACHFNESKYLSMFTHVHAWPVLINNRLCEGQATLKISLPAGFCATTISFKIFSSMSIRAAKTRYSQVYKSVRYDLADMTLSWISLPTRVWKAWDTRSVLNTQSGLTYLIRLVYLAFSCLSLACRNCQCKPSK